MEGELFDKIFMPEIDAPELSGLQVMSSKGGEVEGELFDKILYAWNRRSCWPLVGQ